MRIFPFLLVLAVMIAPARAQVAEAFDICTDPNLLFDEQLAGLAELGFEPGDRDALALGALALTKVQRRDLPPDEMAAVLKEPELQEDFTPDEEAEHKTVWLAHKSGLLVMAYHEHGLFFKDKDYVTRRCSLAVSQDYTGDVWDVAIKEPPLALTSDLGLMARYGGYRAARHALANTSEGVKEARFTGTTLTLASEVATALPEGAEIAARALLWRAL